MDNFGLRVLPVGQLETNCYLIFDRQKGEGLVIDPGDDADYIMRIIADEKIKPLKVLATHGHFDHILAVQELKLAYEIPFTVSKKDDFLIKASQRSAQHFLVSEEILPPPTVDEFLKNGQRIPFGKHQLEVLETPGHTPGSVCFYLREKNMLFCGDTVFADGVGRTDFSYASQKDIEKSLKKIFSLPQETILYPGHGQSITIMLRFKRGSL